MTDTPAFEKYESKILCVLRKMKISLLSILQKDNKNFVRWRKMCKFAPGILTDSLL